MENPSAWRGAPHVQRSEVLDRPGLWPSWRAAAWPIGLAVAGSALVVGGLVWALG